MQIQEIKDFFEKDLSIKIHDLKELAASGSARKNYIASTVDKKFIITYNENIRENEAFFYFTNVFHHLQLNTPEIFSISPDRKLYLQTFLGAQTLSEIISKEKCTERVRQLVTQTLDKLVVLQKSTHDKIDYTKTFEYQEYNEIPILHDLNYFKFMFVDILGIPYHKSTLLSEFNELADKIKNLEPRGLMIRDFQSRNIMVDENDNVHFIDYQSAMKGPLIYDVVSFLFQAKANFSTSFKQEMLDYYYAQFSLGEKDLLQKSLPYLLFIRYLQVLGAYGFRGLVQRKSHFLESIQQGVDNLISFSENWEGMSHFPELKSVICNLKEIELNSKIKEIISI